MGRYTAGDGQYVVYAKDVQEAKQVLSQEYKRVNEIKVKVKALLSKDGQAIQNFETNTSAENLNIYFYDEDSLIFDKPENATTKGEVRQRELKDGNFTYDLAYRYPEIQGQNADFRLAHEMGHLVLNPSNEKMQGYDKETDTRQVSGLIRVPKGQENNRNAYYGEEMQESAINLIGQLAIRGEHSADDIITGKADITEFNSYGKTDELVKLLAVSMRNDYTKEMSFEDLANNGLDSVIEHSDGTQEPANTFFYGTLNDSSIIQKEFDKYMGQGSWIDLNTFIKNLQSGELSNEQFDMIYSEAKGMITDFANARMHDKYQEAMDRDGSNVPNMDNKISTLNEASGIQNKENLINEPKENEYEMPEGYSINEFEEIIRPDRAEQQHQTWQEIENQEQGIKNTRFGAVISPNRYEDYIQPVSQQGDNRLSIGQKIAKFIQKNDFLMSLPGVEKYVNKQLDLLPERGSTREPNITNFHSDREAFINKLTNNGEYRNLPPIHRMSDPQRVQNMSIKMEQNQQVNEENER